MEDEGVDPDVMIYERSKLREKGIATCSMMSLVSE